MSDLIASLRELVSAARQGSARALTGLAAAVLLLLSLVAGGLYGLTDSRAVALEQWIPTSVGTADAPRRSTVLAADGSVVATFGTQDRQDIALTDVAPVMRDALLAAEDDRFYDHGAVDPIGLLRALTTNLAAGHVQEGGSTLTQQYVKQVQVNTAQNSQEASKATETSLSRKVREVGTALAVESKLSKNEILRRYLNLVYFGNGAYGIEVAAHRYFGVPAKDLTLPQAALLAGLVRSPTNYDPLKHPQSALDRRSVVLDRMVSTGRVDAAAAQAAKQQPLGLKPSESGLGCINAIAPFYCEYVVSEVRQMKSLGKDPDARMQNLLTGGLTIHTTLDPKVQQAAQDAIDNNLGRGAKIASAIVMTEPGTGNVRAIAQNRDYGTDEKKRQTTLNYALDKDQGGSAGFQAGSNFKPFVAAAALDKGIDTSQRFVGSRRASLSGFTNCQNGKPFPSYGVGNYQGESYGSLDMAQATAMSVNTYYAQLAEKVGACEPPRLAEAMGVKRADGQDLSRVPSFVLGVDEVSPLRMAEAYATFAADGKHCSSRAVTQITDGDGKQLDVPGEQCKQVLDKHVAEQVTGLLEGVINGPEDRRTGKHLSLGERPAAGKTGTTNDATAVWFTGFTKQLAASVWAGYPGGSIPLKDITLKGKHYDTLFGGALPGPIWHDAMLAATSGQKMRRLTQPIPDCQAKHIPSDLQERCAADPKVVKKKAREQKQAHNAGRWIGWPGPGPTAKKH